MIVGLSGQIGEALAPLARAVELLTTIPGVSQRTAEAVLAGIGVDMARWPSAARLASWAGLCPGNHGSAGGSAGKSASGRTRKGNKHLRTALVEAAKAAARTEDTYLAAHHARVKGRRGHAKATVATVATAHTIPVIDWHLLSRDEPYRDLGADHFVRHERNDAYQRRLVRQLERLGYDVDLQPRAA